MGMRIFYVNLLSSFLCYFRCVVIKKLAKILIYFYSAVWPNYHRCYREVYISHSSFSYFVNSIHLCVFIGGKIQFFVQTSTRKFSFIIVVGMIAAV